MVDLVSRTLPDLVGVHRPQETTGMGWLYFLHRNDWPHWTSTTIHCFVGLYHRLTSKTPRLTVEGGALMALTPILFVSGLLTMLIQPLPELPNLLFLSPLPYTAGEGSYGLAFFWKDGSIRLVGIPLLVLSGTWTLLYAVGLKKWRSPRKSLRSLNYSPCLWLRWDTSPTLARPLTTVLPVVDNRLPMRIPVIL